MLYGYEGDKTAPWNQPDTVASLWSISEDQFSDADFEAQEKLIDACTGSYERSEQDAVRSAKLLATALNKSITVDAYSAWHGDEYEADECLYTLTVGSEGVVQ